MIVVKKDYVDLEKTSNTRRKKTGRKEKPSSVSTLNTMIVLAIIMLIIFIGDLCLITHNKSEDAMIVPNRNKNVSNGLPSKPEERWHYIKELENRQIGVQSLTEPNIDRELNLPTQLTSEQRKFLAQIQTDMRRKPLHLNDVLYNDQSKTENAAQTRLMTRALRNSFNHQLVQILRQTANQTSALSEPIHPIYKSIKTSMVKEVPKEKSQYWLIQCGLFNRMSQADSVRAQLAFTGIESRITTRDGWNSIVLSPCSTKGNANKILQSVRAIGISNCILATSGG